MKNSLWALLVVGLCCLPAEAQVVASGGGEFGTAAGQPFSVTNVGSYGPSTYSGWMNSVLMPAGGVSINHCALQGSWYQPVTAAGYDCAAAPISGTGTMNNVEGSLSPSAWIPHKGRSE